MYCYCLLSETPNGENLFSVVCFFIERNPLTGNDMLFVLLSIERNPLRGMFFYYLVVSIERNPLRGMTCCLCFCLLNGNP